MPELLPFHFGNHEVRVEVDSHNDPWWVAKDVCDILGLDQINRVMARLKPAEKGDTRIMTPGGIQTMRTVNESGLYRLIFRSDKPEAARFQSWVFEEVLPQIRKTGTYAAPAVPQVKNPAHQLLIDTLTSSARETRRIPKTGAPRPEPGAMLSPLFVRGSDPSNPHASTRHVKYGHRAAYAALG